MNEIKLRGKIGDIEFSHTINNTEYQKANLYVPREDNTQDIIPLRFKSISNQGIEDGQEIVIDGNIRSYSQRLENGKNRVSIYVFTYLDPTEDLDIDNYFQVDGRVCKLDKLRSKKSNYKFQFILANNIISSINTQKLNNYLPVVLYGDLAQQAEQLNISDKVLVKGQLHSRTYKKVDSAGNISVRTAIELEATSLEKYNET